MRSERQQGMRRFSKVPSFPILNKSLNLPLEGKHSQRQGSLHVKMYLSQYDLSGVSSFYYVTGQTRDDRSRNLTRSVTIETPKPKQMEACLKCGVKVNPPTLVVFYKSDNKLRKKTMPLRHFKSESNCAFLASELKHRHNLSVPTLKIEKMLRILQEIIKGSEKEDAVKAIEAAMDKSSENLNKLTTRQLELQKQEMDVIFARNQIKKDALDFEYDKRVDFHEEDGNSTWDQEQDADFWT